MCASVTRLASAALAAALAGCLQSAPIIKTEVVEKPVSVPCRVQIPAECGGHYAVDLVSPEADMVTINRALRAEIEQRAACETKLKAAMETCQ